MSKLCPVMLDYCSGSGLIQYVQGFITSAEEMIGHVICTDCAAAACDAP